MAAAQKKLDAEAARIRLRNFSLPKDPMGLNWPSPTNEEILTESLQEFEKKLREPANSKKK